VALYYRKPTLAFLFLWYSNDEQGMNKALDFFKKQKKVPTYVDIMLEGIIKFSDAAKWRLETTKNDNPTTASLCAKLVNYYEK